MMPPDQVCSYQALALAIAELRTLSGEGRWEDAASAMSSLAAHVRDLPAAHDSDRSAIEGALDILARLTEQVRSLREDPTQLIVELDSEAEA